MGLNKFLSCKFTFSKNEELLKFKFKLLNSILVITSVFSMVFALLGTYGINDIGLVQVVTNYFFSFSSILLILFLHSSKNNYFNTAIILIVVTTIVFSIALINVQQDEFRLIWFYLLTFVSYMLLGNRIGVGVTLVSIAIILLANYFVDLNLSSIAITSALIGIVIASLLSKAYTTKVSEYESTLQDALNMLNNSMNNLEDLNKNLEKKVEEEVQKNRLQEKHMHEQSRMAQMGEMISMIAHQWRQPLSAISSASMNLQIKLELEKFDLESRDGIKEAKDYFLSKLKDINAYVSNLTTTIDDFRNFYKPNKKTSIVNLNDIIDKSLNIIKASLIDLNIELIKEYDSDSYIEIYDNEIMQVVLNLLKNSKDVLHERDIKDPFIKITTMDRIILICDNGGGVPEDIIANIFNPYFSTKSEKNGTGLGLYMSKTIVEEHHKGVLSVENTEDGACFKIEFLE